MIAYRPDIDGLRAIAILSVVIFHANPNLLPGGFTGVDIFFAISGFLITKTILEESTSGQFTLVNFWVRRAKRILPALFFMLFAVTAAASVLLMPYDLSEYGDLLSRTILFSANVFLSNERGYFTPEGLSSPLHHVWPLSVAGRYYLIWPIILLILAHSLSARQAIFAVLSLLIISLAYSEWTSSNAAKPAFYNLSSRAFELLIGAALALIRPRGLGSRKAQILSIAGLLLISCSFLFIDETSGFPGLLALIPCLGAAFLLMSGRQAKLPLVNKALSSSVPVHFGKISYSWYLWHWPPLAFANYCLERPLHGYEIALILIFGFAMAEFSYRYVESPFRRPVALAKFQHSFFPAAIICCLLFAGLGAAFQHFQGMPSRLSTDALAVYNKFKSNPPVGCDGGPKCEFGASSARTTMMLWGDSHAEHYLPAIANLAAAEGVRGVLRTAAGCRPFIAPDHLDGNTPRRGECTDYNAKTIAMLRANPQISLVILAGRWSKKKNVGHPFEHIRIFERNLKKTIATLQRMGKTVVVLGQVPERPVQPKNCMAKQLRFGIQIPGCERSLVSDHDQYEKDLWDVMRQLTAEKDNLVLFSPEKHLCDSTSCRATDERGEPLYSDANHLNADGAYFLQPHIGAAIGNLLRAPPSEAISSAAPCQVDLQVQTAALVPLLASGIAPVPMAASLSYKYCQVAGAKR